MAGLSKMPHNFLQVRRINRHSDKNAVYNIDMTFFVQNNPNLHLSKHL